jgi:hypothetical protein
MQTIGRDTHRESVAFTFQRLPSPRKIHFNCFFFKHKFLQWSTSETCVSRSNLRLILYFELHMKLLRENAFIGSLKYDTLRHADYHVTVTYASVLTIMGRILLSRATEAPIFIASCERMTVEAAKVTNSLSWTANHRGGGGAGIPHIPTFYQRWYWQFSPNERRTRDILYKWSHS